MKKDLALITLHGMGERKPRYYEKLERGLQKRLGDDWDRIAFEPVQYASVMQDPQDALWEKMKDSVANRFRWKRTRQFFLFGFSDASAIGYAAKRSLDSYLGVQFEVIRALRKAYLQVDMRKSVPVVVVAQSLGCQVISNYLWDAGAPHGQYAFDASNLPDGLDQDELEFVKLRSLKRLFTTGCNIPLFTAGLTERKSFAAPTADFQWQNFYDSSDVLGWPLSQLGDDFAAIEDHHVNAGIPIFSWNPLSHGRYWKDRDVLDPIARALRNLLP